MDDDRCGGTLMPYSFQRWYRTCLLFFSSCWIPNPLIRAALDLPLHLCSSAQLGSLIPKTLRMQTHIVWRKDSECRMHLTYFNSFSLKSLFRSTRTLCHPRNGACLFLLTSKLFCCSYAICISGLSVRLSHTNLALQLTACLKTPLGISNQDH